MGRFAIFSKLFFSPWTWKQLEGANIFTHCCQVISGPVARNVEDVERVAGNVPRKTWNQHNVSHTGPW